MMRTPTSESCIMILTKMQISLHGQHLDPALCVRGIISNIFSRPYYKTPK